MWIETNGVKLHVQQRGAGAAMEEGLEEKPPALVFLHYWGGSSRTWSPVIGALPASWQTVAIDHRGWGESAPGDGRHGIRDLAADARGVIESLKLGTQGNGFVLVGHSMGGKVALQMAAEGIEGLAGLVLVAPALPGPSPIPLAERERIAGSYASREAALATCRQILTERPLPPEVEAQVLEDNLRGTAAAQRAWPLEAMQEDVRDGLQGIGVPVLVLAGEADKVHPVAEYREHLLPLLPTAALRVLSGCGHLLPLEAPTEIALALERFVTRDRPA